MAVVNTDFTQGSNKRDLFGPQVDLTGQPLFNDSLGAQGEKKEKTRRELLWEQRMQEK